MLEIAKGFYIVKSKIVSMRIFTPAQDEKNPNGFSKIAFSMSGEKEASFSELKAHADCLAVVQSLQD